MYPWDIALIDHIISEDTATEKLNDELSQWIRTAKILSTLQKTEIIINNKTLNNNFIIHWLKCLGLYELLEIN